MSEQYVFGPFRLDVAAFRVWRDELALPVQPKVVELLILLLRRGGELVAREEILGTLWPGVHVSENSLPQVLHKLRELLGEQGAYVETVPRKGLRFAGPIESTVSGTVEPGAWPAERDKFVGREAELAELVRLRDARLLTVTGPGGVGKSRLLWHAHAVNPWLSWYCDASEVRTVDDLLDAVAGSVGVQLGDLGMMGLGKLLARCGSRALVLDGFDALVPHAEPVLGRWLDQAPELKLLVSSRQVLGLRGEVVLPLAPLPLPDAVALFLERARAQSPLEAEPDPLAQLVALLDGLPLALELAASRTRTLSVPELIARLDDRFRVLASRHHSLRATVDWSWDLLELPERAAVASLSVFEGGFSFGAAEAVLGADQALELLSSLVDRSWLARHSGRFSFLSTLHEYAWNKLREVGSFPGSGPEAVLEMERRHGAWAATLDVPGRFPGGTPPHEATLRQEHANLLVACRRALERGDGPVAVATARAAALVPQRHEPAGKLLEQVLALPLSDELYALAAEMLGEVAGRKAVLEPFREVLVRALRAPGSAQLERQLTFLLALGESNEGNEPAAKAMAQRALQMAQEQGDPAVELAARSLLTYLDRADTTPAARERLEEAVALSRAHRDPIWEQSFLSKLGRWHVGRGEISQALPFYEQALQVPGGPDGGARVRYAQLKTQLGQFDPEDYLAALRGFAREGDTNWEALTHGYFAQALVDHGEPQRAMAHIHEAMALLDPEDEINTSWALIIRAQCHLAQGKLQAATADWAAARQKRTLAVAMQQMVAYELHARAGDWAAAGAAAERAVEAATREGTLFVTARAKCLWARACQAQGQNERAAELWREVEQLAWAAGLGPGAWLMRELRARSTSAQGLGTSS